jgi:hypothetical protein
VLTYIAFSKRLLKDKCFKQANTLLSGGIKKNNDNAALLMEMGKLKYIMQIYN